MNILLDTQVALWALVDSDRLSGKIKGHIVHPANTISVSVASLWEIALKHALKRSSMPISAKDAHAYFVQAGYQILPIEPDHIMALETLPPLHGDPFDRLIIAQALTAPMQLITYDSTILRYHPDFAWSQQD